MAFDYKKEYKEFYMPKNKPGIFYAYTLLFTIRFSFNSQQLHIVIKF